MCAKSWIEWEHEILFRPPAKKRQEALAGRIRVGGILDAIVRPGQLVEPRYCLFFHGNGSCLHDCEPMVEHLRSLTGMTIVAFDYRGYGWSGGECNKTNILEDGVTMLQFILKDLKIAPRHVVLWGHSLGAHVACRTAFTVTEGEPLGCLVMYNGFSSLPDVVNDGMGASWYLKLMLTAFYWVNEDALSSVKALQHIRCPVLVIHSRDDTVIPWRNAQRNWCAIPHPHKVFLLTEGHHNNMLITPLLLKHLNRLCLRQEKKIHHAPTTAPSFRWCF